MKEIKQKRQFTWEYYTPMSNFSVWQNKPIFKTEKTLILRQKRRNGGQKTTQKNETNPILTGA
jgi:hypothetical protein